MNKSNDYQHHAAEAARLLEEAQTDDPDYGHVRSEYLAEAQVHATLALAAATREPMDLVRRRQKQQPTVNFDNPPRRPTDQYLLRRPEDRP